MTEETTEGMGQNFTVWAIKTSGWAATDSIAAEDLDIREEDIPDIFRLGRKNLIEDDWRIKLNAPRQKISYFMKSVGKPYIVPSLWAVPNKYLKFVNEWFEKLKVEQAQVVDEFLREYFAIKADMVERYPVLASAVWPSPDKIRRAFRIQKFVFEIGDAKVNKTDPEELIAIKQKYSRELDQSVREMTDLYIKEAYQNIVDNCKDLTDRIVNNTKKVTKTTLKKPAELIRQYEDIVCMFESGSNAPEVKREIARLKEAVAGVSAGDLRAKGPIAEEFARTIANIGNNIGDLSGISSDGRVKRSLALDEAA